MPILPVQYSMQELFCQRGGGISEEEKVEDGKDLWQYLSGTDKHIVLYGMGNGADKILEVCDRYGIVVEDFFASDDFVRGQQFHGRTVQTFDALRDKYGCGRMIILVAFATSLPEVMARVLRLSEVCEVYVPDVPVRGNTLYCREYEREHQEELEEAYHLLGDERSREVFLGVMEYRRTGRLEPLLRTQDEAGAVMDQLLHFPSYRTAVDVGAYTGDTAQEMLAWGPRLEKIWALEPDRRNFRKLCSFAEKEKRIFPVQAAAWCREEALVFEDSGNRNAGVDLEGTARRRITVPGMPLDRLLAKECVDYIKYDVEGSDAQALEGSAALIRQQKPDLLLSLYHRTEDLHRLILQLHRISPAYHLYLRRYPYIPAWDLNLYAVARDW